VLAQDVCEPALAARLSSEDELDLREDGPEVIERPAGVAELFQ
jgi:hypothetical protein